MGFLIYQEINWQIVYVGRITGPNGESGKEFLGYVGWGSSGHELYSHTFYQALDEYVKE